MVAGCEVLPWFHLKLPAFEPEVVFISLITFSEKTKRWHS